MTLFNRRQFLWGGSAALASIALHPGQVTQQGDRYGRVLAQSTPRKVALLVGVNEYPHQDELAGATTDVELQRHLLMHRFGFLPADIHVLTDAQATRQGILAAFEEYLIRAAKPGDVVVFHFSGHGSRVSDQPDCDEVALNLSDQCLNSSFVPVDNPLSLLDRARGGTVLDITGHTLFLLMAALKTENVSAVLDCCYAGGGKRRHLRVRSLEGGPNLRISSAEAQYRQAWLSRLNLSPQQYVQQRRAGVARGMVLAAAGRSQLAVDYPFDGFAAGVFTYALTQYLWQQTGDSVQTTIANVSRTTNQRSESGQVPELEAKLNSQSTPAPTYFLQQSVPPAEAALTIATPNSASTGSASASSVTANSVQVWLGGVAAESLAAFDRGAVFTVLDGQGNAQGQVQLEPNSRNGLLARGKLMQKGPSPRAGTLLRELVRGMPDRATLRLQIALDESLGTARSEAEMALQSMPQIQVVPLQPGQRVDYILGRLMANAPQSAQKLGGVGLFTASLQPLAKSFGATGETVPNAIARLRPRFKSLLAIRLFELILNPNASALQVQVTASRFGQAAFAQVTTRGARQRQEPQQQEPRSTQPLTQVGIPKLPIGQKLQLAITNHEPRDLFLSVLAIDAQADLALLFPNQFNATADDTRIPAGSTLKLPDRDRGDRFNLVVQEPIGQIELLVIASTTPLTSALKAIQAIATRGEPGLGNDPSVLAETLLDDLHPASRTGTRSALATPRSLDSREVAAIAIEFEVVRSL